jgi:hypothetical protein
MRSPLVLSSAPMSTTRPIAKEAEGKGNCFTSTLRTLEQIRTKATADAVIAKVEGPCGEALRQGRLLVIGWYPVSWYLKMQQAIHAVTGEGISITRELARATTEYDFTVLHRLVVKLLSPKTVASHSHRLLQLYWRGGAVMVADSREHLVVIRFSHWQGFDTIMWEDLSAAVEALLCIVGAANARARVMTTTIDQTGADIEARFA